MRALNNKIAFFFLISTLTFAPAANKTFAGGAANTVQTQQIDSTAAEQTEQPEMATALRSSGMIWIVVGVIVIILAGLIIYLISLDKKISRIEKEVDNQP